MSVGSIGSASNIWSLMEMLGMSSTDSSSSTTPFSLDNRTQQDNSASQPRDACGGMFSSEIMMLLMVLQQGMGSDCGASNDATSGISGVSGSQGVNGSQWTDRLADGILSRVDTDHSGGISRSEMESLAQSGGGTADQAASIFTALDTDADGSVSRDEIASGIKHAIESVQASLVGQAMA